MFERLDKLRAEVEHRKKKIEEDKAKLKEAEQRLQAAENSQILTDVSALNLSPEQLNEFLKLVASGTLRNTGSVQDKAKDAAGSEKSDPDGDEDDYENEEESEGTLDED